MHKAQIPANGIVISHAEVLPAWLDYNDHMNVAYYLVAFEQGIDDYKAIVAAAAEASEEAVEEKPTDKKP